MSKDVKQLLRVNIILSYNSFSLTNKPFNAYENEDSFTILKRSRLNNGKLSPVSTISKDRQNRLLLMV